MIVFERVHEGSTNTIEFVAGSPEVPVEKRMTSISVANWETDEIDEEVKAAARLIEAAPKLLAALKDRDRSMHLREAYDNEHGITSETTCSVCALITEAQP